MWAKSKMLHSLSTVLWTPNKHCVLPERCPERELIDRETLTTCLLDAGTRCSGETQSGDSELGNGEQAYVIRDGGDGDDDFFWTGEPGKSREGERGAVDTAGEEPPENNGVEGGGCAS